MRVVVQRVSRAAVAVEGEGVASIERGLLVLLGVGQEDGEKDAQLAAEKICGLRIFEDANEKMNLSVRDVGGQILLVSQFTLYGDARHGKRPSFSAAMEPGRANELYQLCAQAIRQAGVPCQTGVFQTHMEVSLVNDGPVTILYDTGRLF